MAALPLALIPLAPYFGNAVTTGDPMTGDGSKRFQLGKAFTSSTISCDVCSELVAITTVADYIRACPLCAAKIEEGIKRRHERQGK
jgi:hypothetical protein